MRPVSVTLLGPQRFTPTMADVVRSLAVDGPVATVTAGWQEREPDDAELDGLLDGRSVNLALYGRWLDVLEHDPALAAANQRRQQVLDELQALYVIRLHHTVEGLFALERRGGLKPVLDAAVEEAYDAIHQLDLRHLEQVSEVREEFFATCATPQHAGVAEHREAVRHTLAQAGVLTIAGGHVGVLLDCLRLFGVAELLDGTAVVAWSAGAMALTERVVIFNHRAPQGFTHSEIYAAGLGLCRGVVLFPHAHRRLFLDDPRRMGVLARRMAPATCVLLDDGVQLACAARGSWDPVGVRTVSLDGTIQQAAAA
jgi:hypothetical protein